MKNIYLLIIILLSQSARADYWNTYQVRAPEPTVSYPTYQRQVEPVRIGSTYGGGVEVRQGMDRVRCYASYGGSITCR